jgi:two-component system LytT family response regulator
MKAVIVEDERIAAQNLQRLIAQVNKGIEIIAILKSVEDSVEWFSVNPHPDLVFMDIHLSDGASFEIFDKVTISCPVIFTTAYDEYALKAFEVNSIDYLLKPISRKDLERALSKFKVFSSKPYFDPNMLAALVASMKADAVHHKSNFLIPHKDKLIPLSVEKIAFLYFENKMVSIHTFDGEKKHLDTSLDDLYRQLDANKFFRANRQYIIARKAIKDISMWFDNKLSLNLTVAVPEKIIVSRSRVVEFKGWFTG